MAFAIVRTMQQNRMKRALISVGVFVRITKMDVCCGPPSRQ